MRFARRGLPILVALVVALVAVPALAAVALTRVSTDPYTNAASQHRTGVEPDTFAFGSTPATSTIVSAFQVGRVFGGGSANIGWARSADGGATWTTNRFLPGTTTVANPAGPYSAISDPAVAFDARHNVWLISSLGIRSNGINQVVTSRSTNGGQTWSNPVATSTTGNPDKNWIVCDNTTTSPFYGNCYTEWDNTADGNRIKMQTSSNGGLTWGPARNTGDNATGLGGQPLVRPNGTVLVPMNNANQSQIRSFRSVDGGASWRATVLVSGVSRHTVAGGLRTSPLPSAEMDAAGTAYVVWQDCRFRSGCASNDIILSKSTSETTWGPVTRVPIDATSSTVDHFIPGLGVDRSTSGASARIGLAYYYYPTAACSAATCQLNVGFISSTNGGTSWSAATNVTGPMSLSWLANTSQGRMVGDYISTSVLPGGRAWPTIAVAAAPSGGLFDEAMYVPTGGLAVTGGTARSSAAGVVVAGPTQAARTASAVTRH
jgi:hypothetical protein